MRYVALDMLFVAIVCLSLQFGALDAEPAAWMNGVAAIITAVAFLREKSQVREDMANLQTRVAVLESKAQ